MKNTASLLFVLFLITACGSTKHLLQNQNTTVTAKGRFEVQGIWIKDKNSHYDVRLELNSLVETSQRIYRRDMVCGRGSDTGEIIKSGGTDGDGMGVTLPPNRAREFYIVCKTPDHEGDFWVEFKSVYDGGKLRNKTPLGLKWVFKQ